MVRLKGGDLFVFGRGYEELDYAASYSIETEVIPGISSAISVPGLQGIPVTHRGLSDSLWILTGSDADGNLSAELKDAARSKATVVVLLGFDKLTEIVAVYQEVGKGRLPAAVIQNGSMPNEKVAIGIVNTLVEVAEEKQIDSSGPVLLIFGSVVELNRQFQPIGRFFQLIECSDYIG